MSLTSIPFPQLPPASFPLLINHLFSAYPHSQIQLLLKGVQLRIIDQQKKVKDSFINKFQQLNSIESYLEIVQSYVSSIVSALESSSAQCAEPQKTVLSEDSESIKKRIRHLQGLRDQKAQLFFKEHAEDLFFYKSYVAHLKLQALEFRQPQHNYRTLLVDHSPQEVFALVLAHHSASLLLEDNDPTHTLEALLSLSSLSEKRLAERDLVLIYERLKQRVVKFEGVYQFDHQLFQSLLSLRDKFNSLCPQLEDALIAMWDDFANQAFATELAYLGQQEIVQRLEHFLEREDNSLRQLSRFFRKKLKMQIQQLAKQISLQLQHAQMQIRVLVETGNRYRRAVSSPQLQLQSPSIPTFQVKAMYCKFISYLPSEGFIKLPIIQQSQLIPNQGLSQSKQQNYKLGCRLDLLHELQLQVKGWSECYVFAGLSQGLKEAFEWNSHNSDKFIIL